MSKRSPRILMENEKDLSRLMNLLFTLIKLHALAINAMVSNQSKSRNILKALHINGAKKFFTIDRIMILYRVPSKTTWLV